ncbi:MAG: acetyl-CoA carboxylase carboxyl transferase subunit alpha, partial [Porticoccaceae bacterium]
VDETIPEPMGGAHRDIEAMSATIKEHLSTQLDELQAIPVDDLLERRYQRLMSYGRPD